MRAKRNVATTKHIAVYTLVMNDCFYAWKYLFLDIYLGTQTNDVIVPGSDSDAEAGTDAEQAPRMYFCGPAHQQQHFRLSHVRVLTDQRPLTWYPLRHRLCYRRISALSPVGKITLLL